MPGGGQVRVSKSLGGVRRPCVPRALTAPGARSAERSQVAGVVPLLVGGRGGQRDLCRRLAQCCQLRDVPASAVAGTAHAGTG